MNPWMRCHDNECRSLFFQELMIYSIINDALYKCFLKICAVMIEVLFAQGFQSKKIQTQRYHGQRSAFSLFISVNVDYFDFFQLTFY